MAGPATRFGTYKVTEWREGVQPQKTWIQKRMRGKLSAARFSSATSIFVARVLIQTGLVLCIPWLGTDLVCKFLRTEDGSRALLAFPLPLALYARVLSKPG